MSFGSAIGAIVSLRNNKRESKRRPGDLPGTSTGGQGVKSHRTPCQQELEQLRSRLREENKKRQRKIFLIFTVFLLLFCVLFFYLMF